MLGWQGCPRSCLQPRKDLQVKQEENIIFFTPFTCNATCKVFKIKAKYSVNLFIFLSKKLVKTQKSKPKVLHYLVFFSFDSFHLTRKTTSLKNFGFVDVFQNLHSRRPDSAFYSSQCWCWLRQRRSHFWMCTNFKSWKQARAGPSAKCQWSPVRVSKIILFYVKHTLQKTSFRSIAGIAAELARSPSAATSV